jgi:hypothetical protein
MQRSHTRPSAIVDVDTILDKEREDFAQDVISRVSRHFRCTDVTYPMKAVQVILASDVGICSSL